ncbi:MULTISPECIES: antibiotic biosynthesis monooxygenase [Alcanivorax]|uniref:antibiotic biosynthesis monooxygenase n=1 Tax=Alcanivorax TaxID=59753 RepID=UPI0025B898B8|nr:MULTISPECIES: antibiotic biosynthesis monooxygenase [Alcanivorax]
MNDKQPGVSILIEHQVKPEYSNDYENWLPEIIDAAAGFPGHQGVNILKHHSGSHHYNIAVRFECQQHADEWLHSDIRRHLISEVDHCLAQSERLEMRTGIDNWFELPSSGASHPVRWKQWLLTTLVITALTMIVPPILAPVFNALPALGIWGVRHFISAAIIVGLVVYVVMPRVVALTAKWLFSH